MLALVRLIGLRHLSSRPLRTTLTLFGVALGVALTLAIDIVNTATIGFFRDSVMSVAGKARLTISGGESGFDESVLDVVKKIPGVKHAAPMVSERATFIGADGAPRTIVILGIDLLAEQQVRTYKTTNEQVVDDPLVFLNQADSIIVTQSFARDNGLTLESPFEMLTAHGKEPFTVRGMLSPVGPAKAFGGGLAIMDIDGARATFGKDGKTDRIDIVPADGVDELTLSRRIEAALGPGFHAEPPESQASAFERMVSGYQTLLAFLGSLALVVALLLVGNTMVMSVAERRKEIGVLRAVGATKSGVLAAILVEAAALAVVGSLFGVMLGRFGASTLVSSVSQSMSAQFTTPIDVGRITASAAQMGRAAASGIVAAVVAALWPALSATRVQPVDALRPSDDAPEERERRRSRGWRWLGVALLVLLGVATRTSSPALRSIEPLAAVLGAALAAPWVVGSLLRLVRGAVGAHVFVVRLATENLLRRPKRTGSNVLALMVGLSLVIVMAIVQASFETTVLGWVGRILSSDLVVSSTGNLAMNQVQPLHEDVGREIDAVPGVDVVDGRGARGFRFVRASYEGREIGMKACDRPTPSMNWAAFDTSNGRPETIAPRLFAGGEPVAMISDNFALHFHKTVGDSITLDSPGGPVTMKIVGTVVDFASPEGVVLLPRELYKAHWKDPLVTAFAVMVRPGFTRDAVQAGITTRLGARGLVVMQSADLRAQMGDVLRESFAYTRVIEIAALIVGLLGLLNTALVGVLERTRELGMLRAVGMSRAQLAWMILTESALLGALGGLAAAAIGAYISYVWLVGSLSAMLGWVIQVSVPWGSIGATLGAGLVVGAVAGLAASSRARRIEIREALAQES